MAKLTIAIPTYNRNTLVLTLVRNLLAQLKEGCEILVLDNGCSTPVSSTLEEGIPDLRNQPIHVIRLKANTGQPALRCMELCETPWMWLLTDKAVLRPDALTTVLRTIQEHSDCMFINFTPLQHGNPGAAKRAVSIETRGQDELIENIIDYGAIIDYLANLYHVPSLKNSLGPASWHMGSGAPQFAVVLHAVSDSGKCFLSSEVPAERPRTPPEMRWSQLDYMESFMTPLNLVKSRASQLLLATHILGFMPSRKYFISKFLLMALSNRDQAEYYYGVYKRLMRGNDRRLSTRLYLQAGNVLMLAPKLSAQILEMLAQKILHRSLREAA